MKHSTLFTLLALPLVAACSSAPASKPEAPAPKTEAPPTSTHDAALESALTKIAAASDGIVAVSVRHLGDGRRASLHGDARLPMMSVFKLPLAVVALAMVDDGALKLDQIVPITEAELRPVSPIAEEWRKGTHTVTLETLIVRAIQDSDNTAGDKLVALEGGGPAITARLRKLGMNGVEVGEPEIEIFAREFCPAVARPAEGWTMPAIEACPKLTPEARMTTAQYEIDHAPNAATTDALVEMLAVLEGPALAKHRTWLRDTLAGTKTGTARLKGLLPAGTRVEHKTGTDEMDGFGIATNDVGVITLPDGARVAIAVLSSGSHKDRVARERVIAELAKATWDRFVK
jgi:beta-lactamase class A